MFELKVCLVQMVKLCDIIIDKINCYELTYSN